jgi:hypothetical protein
MVLGVDEAGGGGTAGGSLLPAVQTLQLLTRRLASGAAEHLTDAERIDFLAGAEQLKCALEGAQAAVSVGLEASQRAVQSEVGIRAEHQGRGVALQIALARHESHHRGQRHLQLARDLHADYPHTLAALRSGKVSEWRAALIVRETKCLSPENRQLADVCLAEDQAWLEGQGDRQLIGEARRLAYRFEPTTFVDKARRAERERRVTTRPAPDTMCYLTALLPVMQAVAVYAALKTHADSLINAGDSRTRDQIIADTLVERVTGQASADHVPVEVGVVLSDRTLVGMDDEPATVRGYGPIPADVARYLISTGQAQALATLRRLYASTDGVLVGRDSTRSRFPDGLADLLHVRDGDLCRTPWCNAPIRHTDHIVPKSEGGPTTFRNGQGLCEACNIAKEAIGWRARPRPGPDGHAVHTTTPTGHRYTSVAPRIRFVHRPPITVEYYIPQAS